MIDKRLHHRTIHGVKVFAFILLLMQLGLNAESQKDNISIVTLEKRLQEYRATEDWTNYFQTLKSYDNFDNRGPLFKLIQKEQIALEENNHLFEAGYIWNFAGRICAGNGDFVGSFPHYEKAIKLLSAIDDTSKLHLIHYYYSQTLLFGKNDAVAALEQLTEGLRVFNKKKDQDKSVLAKFYYAKGVALRGYGKLNEAIENFILAKENSGDPYGYYETFLCRSYLESGEYNLAFHSAQIANEKSHEPKAEYTLLLARANAGIGNKVEAYANMRKAIDLIEEKSPSNTEYIKLFYFLAKMQMDFQDYEAALLSCKDVYQSSAISNFENKELLIPEINNPSPNLWVLD
ncbi:MAG: hypothetical protein AAGK97_17420, partial [Bacteroidota bacterium]